MGHSTDLADALALTFAVNLPVEKDSLMPELDRYGRAAAGKARDWMTGEYDGEQADVLSW